MKIADKIEELLQCSFSKAVKSRIIRLKPSDINTLHTLVFIEGHDLKLFNDIAYAYQRGYKKKLHKDGNFTVGYALPVSGGLVKMYKKVK